MLRAAFPVKGLFVPFVLSLFAILIFFTECRVFHFAASTAIDVIWFAELMVVPGTLIVLLIDHYFQLSLELNFVLSMGSAAGFGIPPFILAIIHALDLPHPTTVFYIAYASVTVLCLSLIITRKITLGYGERIRTLNILWCIVLCVLVWFAIYNLQNFHFSADGSIVTRGLFGVDIPFLAGEIHGIQDYGVLRDLHQMAQPWHYHDATYQLLALLPRDRTLEDLAFTAPLVGYTLLAFSVFTLLRSFTKRTFFAIAGASAWFLVSSFTGTEQGSYALSSSFVFGSLIFVNILLVLDKWSKESSPGKPWIKLVWIPILLYLFIELSQTKLSTFLAVAIATVLLGTILLKNKRADALMLLGVSTLSLLIVVFQTLTKNPLMPGNDFLIGAPLMGYANHLAAILHMPVSVLNPVSHGLSLHIQSLLIIPYFLFHFIRFAIVDPRILASILLIVFFRKSVLTLGQVSREVIYFLLILIPLGFFLPVLYSPSWYPLALSFYTPLVSVQAALLFATIGVRIIASNQSLRKPRVVLGFILLLFTFGFVQNIHFLIGENSSHADTVSLPFRSAMNVLLQQQPDTAIIATRRFASGSNDSTNNESFYWYSALSGHPVLSEGAKYGSLLAAVADVDQEKGLHPIAAAESTLYARRALLDTIYLSRDSQRVRNALITSKAAFILEDKPIGQQLGVDPHAFAKEIFSNSACTIWKTDWDLWDSKGFMR